VRKIERRTAAVFARPMINGARMRVKKLFIIHADKTCRIDRKTLPRKAIQ
jgi:hypothetical protein